LSGPYSTLLPGQISASYSQIKEVSNEISRLLRTVESHLFPNVSALIKKEKQIFLIYKEIQNGAVAKSYKTNGLLIYGEIFPHFLIY
jgi:hypothetical protein